MAGEMQDPAVETRRNALIEQLVGAAHGVFDIFGVYLGDQLGLYTALGQIEPATASELAARTDTNERSVREWLEQQTVSGILEVDNPRDGATDRRYCLPPGHDEVLTDTESLNYLAPLAQVLVGAVHPVEQLKAAFRGTGGVPYSAYGVDLHEGQARMNRNLFLQQLGNEYLPAIPDLHARLQSDPPARVADIGMGHAYSSIGIATAYPNAHVDGFDVDEASVIKARQHVERAGLADRVTIHHRDAGDPELAGQYDLVTAFECIHDMADPVSALRTMRRLANGHGTVLIMDERVEDEFTPEGTDVERFMYGFSFLHCLPVGMADQPSAGTGTVMRPPTLRRYAQEAGFADIEILPLENFFFTFYRLIG